MALIPIRGNQQEEALTASKLLSVTALAVSAVFTVSVLPGTQAVADAPRSEFERVGTFVVCENTSCDTSVVETTVAEIVAASADGRTLVYTDSPQGVIGLVDIADPARPRGLGVVKLDGEPTSVEVAGRYALVAVNTSPSFTQPAGHLAVFDLHACRDDVPGCTPVAKLDMGGQPDSVAVSPDGRYAAIVIENERDEDVNDGQIPQPPAGFLNVVDLKGAPDAWKVDRVDLTGITAIAPSDPEPEFVKINRWNVAAVTLQENNHVVLVHLPSRKVIGDFPAGEVALEQVDTEENDVIEPVGALPPLKREPDAIAWLGDARLVTANEGDLEGGTRGFSIFLPNGRVLFDAGNRFDHLAIRHGHYPETRSENKGSEPEGVVVGEYGDDRFIFVGAERANFVAVYRDRGWGKPEFVQLLPTGIGPEGLLAIPKRRLFVASTEVDEGYRSQINIFRLQRGPASYPNIVSGPAEGNGDEDARGRGRHDDAGAPIGWGALSALAADRRDPSKLYAVHDSVYKRSRIYTLDVGGTPAVITTATVLRKAGAFVDYDLEGLAQRSDGTFWAVSEGAGNAPSATSKNLLIEIAADGTVMREIELPAAVNARQVSSGFEGVTVVGAGASEKVYVAFQREWQGDPKGLVRIGEYRPAEDAWRFFFYPLDPVQSPAGGWVGLSEITALGDDRFAVIERDNQGGPNARIKKIAVFSIAGLAPQPEGGAFPVVAKQTAIDMLPRMKDRNGWVLDKLEGFAVARNGAAYAVTDNDGVDESSGETQFFRLGKLRD
jgi:hypothetical protein